MNIKIVYYSSISLLVTWGYWFGFNKGPNFITVWFIGSAMSQILAWVSQIFILKEGTNQYQILGFTMILIGGILMRKI